SAAERRAAIAESQTAPNTQTRRATNEAPSGPIGASAAPTSEIATLIAAARPSAEAMSVRALLAAVPGLALRLAPCVLATPHAVARHLPAALRFDVVVFDEASQLATAEALGALARGRSAVIAGDARQMPPAHGDSIVDACLAARVPELRLAWHYRSRHEDLFAFANAAFYGDRLQVVPATHASPDLGVSYRRIYSPDLHTRDTAPITIPFGAAARSLVHRTSDDDRHAGAIVADSDAKRAGAIAADSDAERARAIAADSDAERARAIAGSNAERAGAIVAGSDAEHAGAIAADSDAERAEAIAADSDAECAEAIAADSDADRASARASDAHRASERASVAGGDAERARAKAGGIDGQHAGDIAAVSDASRAEAEAVVAEVIARLKDPAQCTRSIAVVACSPAQRALIEDLLDEARASDAAVDAVVELIGCGAVPVIEPVIVKEIADVQGDERDVVLISLGDARPGAHALAVATTRAREQLVVFSSVAPEDLPPGDLATFLHHARTGGAGRPSATPASPITEALARALGDRGWTVRHQIGCGAYRVELAVVDPNDPDLYVIEIETYGAAYASAPAARDRDRLRALGLAQLGWRTHRVWSLDWWLDPEREIQRAHGAIVTARARRHAPAPHGLGPDARLPRTGRARAPAAEPQRARPTDGAIVRILRKACERRARRRPRSRRPGAGSTRIPRPRARSSLRSPPAKVRAGS
ncbi:MAG: hypothetical protein KIT31_39525, partial [Deltaproteobacteria bacterium]|nr:hypothetical protein [Deltaproteobacteria bacterium]